MLVEMLIVGYIISVLLCGLIYYREAKAWPAMLTWGYLISRTIISMIPGVNALIVLATGVFAITLYWNEPVFKEKV